MFIITISVLLMSQPMLGSTLKRLFSFSYCTKTEPFGRYIGQCHKMKTLSEWNFEQPSRLEQLPFDSVKENFVRRVRNAVFSHVLPTKLESEIKLVAASSDVLQNILDLDPLVVNSDKFLEFVAGNYLLPDCQPFSHRYGGYQFGFWADQLGDGRAHLLGGYINSKDEYWELQLKGSGKTPYSRNGDGRAVLRSSIREFLCSEAMHGLGIPTSRAAAVVVSNDAVIRDQFYNGRIRKERAAVVLRLAPSWFRIGSLEILTKEKEIDNLKQLVDFVINNYFPEITPGKYTDFYKTVFNQSVALVAQWMAVGFTHGVLNTDNMSLLSITIDYGPFGFLDSYNPVYIPNYTDDEGRYCYANQPYIFKWNLARLADALEPLISDGEMKELRKIGEDFDKIYQELFLKNFRKKLGFSAESDQHEKLIALLLDMMDSKNCDFTQTFRQLGEINLNDDNFSQHWALDVLSSHKNFTIFMELYRDLVKELNVSESERKTLMEQTNPQYVLRNWMAEAAIRQAETDDFYLSNLLLRILQNPFQRDPEAEEAGFSRLPPSWSRTLKVSCSS